MELIILFLLMWLAPLLSYKYIITKDDLLLMSPFKSLVMPYVAIGALIYCMTVLLVIIRTLRTCNYDQYRSSWWGLKNGLKLGFCTSFLGCVMYVIVGLFPLLTLPFLAISVLPNATDIGEGFYVALAGILGYWMGRIFVSAC